jgi:AcrR family transcriptional regulator
MKTRPYHHGDLRSAVLEASLSLLDEGGQDALSLREAARRAGVSHAAPYRHFPDKQALLAALSGEGYHLLASNLREAATAAGDAPRERLTALGAAYLHFALEHPALLDLMFSSAGKDLDGAASEAHTVLIDEIRLAQSAGLIRSGDPMLPAAVLWSQVHGMAGLIGAGKLSCDPDAVRRGVDAVLDGLG